MSSDPGKAFFEQFIDDYFAECEEHLTTSRSLMLELEKADPAGKPRGEVLDELLRDFHSIKGLSAMVGMEEVTQLAHHVEDYLRELDQPQAEITTQAISQVLAAIAAIEEVLNARRKSQPLPDVTSMLLTLTHATQEAQHKLAAKPARRGRSAAPAAAADREWKFEFRPSAQLAAR